MKRFTFFLLIFTLFFQNLTQPAAVAETQSLPYAATSSISSSIGASSNPSNLISLSATVLQSVVTVVCGNKLGSGWAINVAMTQALSDKGFSTYLITNHHVIADCTPTGSVSVILPDKSRISGTILAFDENYDLAGILISSKLPALSWQASTPAQGFWVGVMGSPLGFPGVLTTGIVSSINLKNLTGTLTAPINPGNSGGPVFDNSGRVIGVATAKYTNSEGFGIFGGSPLLCVKIVSCPQGTNAWFGNTTASSLINVNPIHLKMVEITTRTNEANLGALFCAIGPRITKEIITSYEVTGTQWRITDLTTNAELDSFFVPIRIPSDGFVDTRDLTNGRMSTKPVEDVQAVLYDFKSQTASHVYECSVAVVARNMVGEFSSINAEAKVSTTNYKPLPPKIMQDQSIMRWNLSSRISSTIQTVILDIKSTSSLPVSVVSNTKSVCFVSGTKLIIANSGRCIVTASQAGDSNYHPAEDRIFILEVQKSKLVSILCASKKVTKKITAPNPTCPAGFQEKI